MSNNEAQHQPAVERSGIRVAYENWSVADAKADGREAWAEMTPEQRLRSEIQACALRLDLRSVDLYGRVRARMRLTWRASRTRSTRRSARCVRVARVARVERVDGGGSDGDGPPGPSRFVERNQRHGVRP